MQAVIVAAPVGDLSDTERARFSALEETIEKGFKQFLSVGRALQEIDKDALYRSDYDTFEDYCRERWNIARSTGYSYIKAADALNGVNAPLDTIITMPKAAAIELNRLPTPELRSIAIQGIQAVVPGMKLTKGMVESAVNVLEEAISTNHVDLGERQVAIEAAITQEEYERMLRQQQYIIDRLNKTPRTLVLKAKAQIEHVDGNRLTLRVLDGSLGALDIDQIVDMVLTKGKENVQS